MDRSRFHANAPLPFWKALHSRPADGDLADLMPPVGLNYAGRRNRNLAATLRVVWWYSTLGGLQ
jgi:hypothetical protein